MTSTAAPSEEPPHTAFMISDCVGAAEAEAVVEHGSDRPLLGLVRHEVDTLAALARIIEVERRRDDLVAHREDAEDTLDRSRAAEQMADRRLGRAHRHVGDGVAEQPPDRAELQLVAERRRGAVRVDVIDVRRLQSRTS